MRPIYFIIVMLLISISCSKDAGNDEDYMPVTDTVAFKTTPLNFEVPSNFPELTYPIKNNPPTEEGFELGRQLFFEGDLSSSGVISCGECHRQEFAFTHHTHIVSHGVNGLLGTRNAPSMQNMAFMKDFNWDGAAKNLDMQPVIPITSKVEMNETFANILIKLKKDKKYPPLFSAAFENGTINAENMLKAISQFVVMMISADSKYDRVIRNEGGISFTEDEKAGLAIFQNKCAQCHTGELFTDQSYRNNGLPIDSKYNDQGRKMVTGDENDIRKFKVPSLRNIELTLPYMHDGRFGDLKKVLDFYSEGMTDSPTLDPQFKKNGKVIGIPLTEDEKLKLITFLKTLTDNSFASNRKFAEF